MYPQTLKTVCEHITKQLKLQQKYSDVRVKFCQHILVIKSITSKVHKRLGSSVHASSKPTLFHTNKTENFQFRAIIIDDKHPYFIRKVLINGDHLFFGVSDNNNNNNNTFIRFVESLKKYHHETNPRNDQIK